MRLTAKTLGLVKVRKEVLDEQLAKRIPPQALRFLEDHASWTVSVLKLAEVQEFLSLMLRKEEMNEGSVPEVVVMVLPYPHASREAPIAHGSFLPGLCQIRVYPGLASYHQLEGMTDAKVRKFQEVVADGDSGIRFAQRHILTVIHEILHVKYGHDEPLVELRSHEYMDEFFAWLKSRPSLRAR